MSELKVQEAPHLVRRGRAPAVLVNTNTAGFLAAKQAHKRAQEAIDLKDEVEILRELVGSLLGGSK